MAQQAATACGQTAPSEAAACGQPTAAASGCGQSATTVDAPSSNCGLADAEHQPLNAEEMAVWRAFLMAATYVTAALNRELMERAGISLLEYEILVRLREAENQTLRMSVLAQGTAQSRSRLTHTVVRLEKTGHVERSMCPSDRRGVYCHLTDSGARFLAETAPLHLDGVRRHVIDKIPAAKLAALAKLLQPLAD